MISPLIIPDSLFIPLPTAARVQVTAGEAVRCGQRIATSDSAADILSPADGVVGGVVEKPLAMSGQARADCLILNNATAAPPLSLPRESQAGDFAAFLKRAGIVGLGGGGFPTFRKWRPQLKLLIINAIESDPLSCCDEALIELLGARVLDMARRVGARFAAQTRIALAHHIAPTLNDEMVVRCHADYAAGSEQLLLRHILNNDSMLAAAIPADYGYVCINVATLVAIDDAITNGTPMISRIVSIHTRDGIVNKRIAFGTPLKFVAAALGIDEAIYMDNERADEDAVITASTPPLVFENALNKTETAAPCIRCGWCEQACPVNISPMLLHHHTTQLDDMENLNLESCLLCRRCDEVCPSHIPLTQQFAAAQRQLEHARAQRAQQQHWQQLYTRHQQTQARPVPRANRHALRAQVAAHRSSHSGNHRRGENQ